MQFHLELSSATVPLLLAETMTVAELVAKIVDAARSHGVQIDEFVTNSRILLRGLPLMAPDYAPPRACLLVEAGIHSGVPEAERVLRVQHVKINFCCRGAPFVAPERETLKQMLRLEVALRTSNHALRAMGALVDSGEGDWMDVVKDMIQLPVTRAYGYKGAVAEEMALDCMLNARHLFPDDPDFVEIPFYVKYNRARDGPLVVGQTAPQVEVVPLDDVTKRVPLYDLGKVTVLFAGSIT